MTRKIWLTLLITLAAITIVSLLAEESEAATRTVGPGGTYSTIMDAINASSPSDEIHVYEGWYNESMPIYLNHTLRLYGNGTDQTYVSLNYSSTWQKQILITNADNCRIDNMSLTGTFSGIPERLVVVNYSEGTSIENCTIFDANQAYGNDMDNHYGIYLQDSNDTAIKDCNITGVRYGIRQVFNCNNTLIHDNIIDANIWTLSAFGFPNYKITNSTIRDNAFSGAYVPIRYFSFAEIYDNSFTGYGLRIEDDSNNCSIHNNIISGASVGLEMDDNTISNISVYENVFRSNTVHAEENGGTDTYWNTTARGNYWDNWTSPDIDHDGVVDNPYIIGGTQGGTDYLPLALAANISSPANNSNHQSLSLSFWANGSANADYYNWTWGDGTYTNTTGLMASHTFPRFRAHYEVNLTVLNETLGWQSAVSRITISIGPLSVENRDTSRWYAGIQAAIDDVTTLDGHTLLIGAGVYAEHITVSKELNLSGASSDTVLIRPVSGDSITVAADNVELSGIAVESAISNGLQSNGYDGLQIVDCRFNNSGAHGVYVHHGISGDIASSIFHNNTQDGLKMYLFTWGSVETCTFNDNVGAGFYLLQSSHRTIHLCDFSGNQYGLRAATSTVLSIWHNNFVSNTNNAWDTVSSPVNVWNEPLPLGGNYYSNYNTPDVDNDGFVDLPYSIPGGGNGIDNYPYAQASGWDHLHIVNSSGSAEFLTIQAAEDISVAGDYIWVQYGVYTEAVTIDVSGLTVRGDGASMVSVVGGTSPAFIVSADNIRIFGLNISGSSRGISVSGDTFNITENEFYDNDYGLYAQTSSNGRAYGNTFVLNTVYGAYLLDCTGCEVYNNDFVSNTAQAYDNSQSNSWYLPLPTGGNYWDDWTGPDSDNDGFVDIPRIIDGYILLNQDSLPVAVPGLWGSVLYVNQSGSKDYTTIQDAIDAAGNGYYIFVDAGVYTEQLTINKQVTIIGEGMSLVIITPSSGHAVIIQSSYVSLSNMSMENLASGSGIYSASIYSYIDITYCGIDNASGSGIYLNAPHYIGISYCVITNTGGDGIALSGGREGEVHHNYIWNSSRYGLYLLQFGDLGHPWRGANVTNNTFYNASTVGCRLYNSEHNLIYHNNFLNNTMHAEQLGGTTNYWNTTYPSNWQNLSGYSMGLYGGNYWEGYTDYDNASGPAQTNTTAGRDGFWDTPYTIPGGTSAADYYPFVEESGWEESQSEFLANILGAVAIMAIIMMAIGVIGKTGRGGF